MKEAPPTSYSVPPSVDMADPMKQVPPSVDMAVNAINQMDGLRKENERLRKLVEEAYKAERPNYLDLEEFWLVSAIRKHLMEGE